MKTVQRANKQLRVTDDRLEDMEKFGYVEVDSRTGRPVKFPVSDTDAALKKENAALKKENKTLKDKIQELTAKLDTMVDTAGS